MKNREIHLLVTFNSKYIRPFCTMLYSLLSNNPGESVHVWLLHSVIPSEERHSIDAWCAAFTPLRVNRRHADGPDQSAGNRPAGGYFCLRAGSRGGASAAGLGRFQLSVRRRPAAAGRRVEL